jgi:mono/diheme cytochrome c family protein
MVAVVSGVVGLFTLFPWSSGSSGAEVIDGSDPDLVALGKGIYSGHSASCHGGNPEGGARLATC